MAAREILLLGNPLLYERCAEVTRHELGTMQDVASDLADTLIVFRATHGFGRAIAAPQIGVSKRLIYMHIEAPVAILNPIIEVAGDEMMELWDDCMSFPDLLVRVKRHAHIRLRYKDPTWNDCAIDATGSIAELLQHEYDHLDGILAIQRAVEGRSIVMTKERQRLGI